MSPGALAAALVELAFVSIETTSMGFDTSATLHD